MIVGGYTLDLYCDAAGCPHKYERAWNPREYVGECGPALRRRARQDGWRLNLKEGAAICPECVRAEKERAR